MLATENRSRVRIRLSQTKGMSIRNKWGHENFFGYALTPRVEGVMDPMKVIPHPV